MSSHPLYASCDRCRAQKIRCDGQRPCSACKQKYKLMHFAGVECIYSPAKRRGPVPGSRKQQLLEDDPQAVAVTTSHTADGLDIINDEGNNPSPPSVGSKRPADDDDDEIKIKIIDAFLRGRCEVKEQDSVSKPVDLGIVDKTRAVGIVAAKKKKKKKASTAVGDGLVYATTTAATSKKRRRSYVHFGGNDQEHMLRCAPGNDGVIKKKKKKGEEETQKQKRTIPPWDKCAAELTWGARMELARAAAGYVKNCAKCEERSKKPYKNADNPRAIADALQLLKSHVERNSAESDKRIISFAKKVIGTCTKKDTPKRYSNKSKK